MRRAVRLAVLLAVLILNACRDRASPAADGETIVADTLDIDVAIGGVDDRPEYEFGRIYGIIPSPDGRVIIADMQNHVVRVYDASGTHRYSFGHEGAGPGEFNGPCCLAFDHSGNLWVRDGGNARYNNYQLFADSAHFLTQRRMAHSDVNRVVPLTFDESGNMVDIGSRHDAQSQLTTVRMHLDSSATVVREEVMHAPPRDSTAVKEVQRQLPGGGVATLYTYQIYGPAELHAHAPGGEFAHALSSRYEIDWRDPGGQLIRHISGDVQQGPPLSERERGVAEERLQRDSERLSVSRAQLGYDVPSHKTPLRGLYFDLDGRLWVELSVADGAHRIAHVYDRQGTLERIVSWPSQVDLTLGAIQGTAVWGIATDSLDVASVVRLRSARR